MKTALIIHGHFYQPPRENPNTGVIEDQPSAAPYKNWNESIYQTCYKPNAYSRYLNQRGKILLINNNYERISSNFGPTLLKWMETEHPQFINQLMEADRKSIKELGHSNLIAQCYNHTILPLDSVEIKRIEISWALDDYRKRFGHDSEGFWCSECAIDAETIDELAKAGVRFVVLSPWQATAINGVSLNGKPAPCDRPFIIKGINHTISAFFYDPDLASGISFGHYLQDADRLYNHLVEMKKTGNDPALINCATDGEIYGHHEPFGDMALCALLKKIDEGKDFYITNYGAYLEQHPAVEEASLFNGKNHSGSSWSCCHGVERWCSDCGCHTGGPNSWNQKWRTPLRKALNNLENSAKEILTSCFREIIDSSVNYDDVVVDYGKVVVGLTSVTDFLADIEKKYNKQFDVSDKNTIVKLLESYKNILFSFTSCGWFFNDISGIEPQQNITYALNAASFLQKYGKTDLKQKFFSDLSKAVSNIPEKGNGADIAMKCDENIPGSVTAGFFFARNSLDIHFERFKYQYGIFKLQSVSDSLVNIENSATLEVSRFFFTVEYEKDGSLRIRLKNTEDNAEYSKTFPVENYGLQISNNDLLDMIMDSFGKEIKKNGLNDAKVSILLHGLDCLRAQGIEPNLAELQNVAYKYITKEIPADISEASRRSLVEKLNFAYELL